MKKNKKTENEIKKNVNSSENKSQLSLSPGYQINGGVRGHKYNTTWLPTDARKLDQIRVSVSASIRRACKLANWTIGQSSNRATRLLAKIITRTKPLTSTNDCAGYHGTDLGPVGNWFRLGPARSNATHDVWIAIAAQSLPTISRGSGVGEAGRQRAGS